MSGYRRATALVTDRDRKRACRLAHAFGVAVAAVIMLLAAAVTAFRARPLTPPEVLVTGLIAALAAGLAADLAARPPLVESGDGWLAVTRLRRRRRVRTGRLVSLAPHPHAAGVLVLADADGGRLHVDVRCLAKNPVIWHRLEGGVCGSLRQGRLTLPGPHAAYWEQVCAEVRETQWRLLAALDFGAGRGPDGEPQQRAAQHRSRRHRTGRRRTGNDRDGPPGPAAGLGLASRLAGSALLVGWLTRPAGR